MATAATEASIATWSDNLFLANVFMEFLLLLAFLIAWSPTTLSEIPFFQGRLLTFTSISIVPAFWKSMAHVNLSPTASG
jgi:hypothetical protein